MLTVFTHCVYPWQVDVTANEFPLRFVCLKPAIDNINVKKSENVYNTSNYVCIRLISIIFKKTHDVLSNLLNNLESNHNY
jgi:hypothetical protein